MRQVQLLHLVVACCGVAAGTSRSVDTGVAQAAAGKDVHAEVDGKLREEDVGDATLHDSDCVSALQHGALPAARTSPQAPDVVSAMVQEARRTFAIPSVLAYAAQQIAWHQAGALAQQAWRYLEGSYEFRSGIGPLGLPLAVQIINDTPYRVTYAGYRLYSGKEWAFPVLWEEAEPGEMLQWLLYTEANTVDATILLKNSAGDRWALAVQRLRFQNPLSPCDRLRFKAVRSYEMTDARGGGLCHARGTGSGRGVDVHAGYSLTMRLSELEV